MGLSDAKKRDAYKEVINLFRKGLGDWLEYDLKSKKPIKQLYDVWFPGFRRKHMVYLG